MAADPGNFPGEGASNPKKTHWRRLKVTKTNRIWYSWGKGCPPFSLPPSLVSVAQFSFFPQLYRIQLVLVTLRLAAKDGPPDINSLNLHVKSRKAWKNIGFTCTKFPPFPQPYQIGDSSLWPQGTVVELPSGTSPGPPQNPKSGIQNPKFPNPKSKILDHYVAFLYMRPPPPQISGILDFGFRILDFGFWISDFGFWILDFGFWISDFGFWILDFGFWILDFGALCSNSSCANFGFWILDFGFWILDFGFRILDFGFWILVWGRFRGHFLDAT